MMAYAYIWPSQLPQAPQKGFTETGGALVLRTQMDAGIAKQRRRGLSPQQMSTTFILTTEQVATFENFVSNTIKGVARFGFPHPRTQQVVEVRIISQSEGTLYNLTYLAPGYWTLALQLEILP
jgi:hypothetical protein